MTLDDKIKELIFDKLNDIIKIDNLAWNKIDNTIKIKIIHHYCNYLTNDKSIIYKDNFNKLNIPLKSLKPKKIIEFCSINKKNNSSLFSIFNKQILEYTFEFRKKFLEDKKIYYSYNNLPKIEYDTLLNNYTNIVFNFISNNKKTIDCVNLYLNLTGNNSKKVISQNNTYPKNFICKKYDDYFEFVFDNNIIIRFELYFYSNKITKNIPVKYNIKLVNSF